MSGPEAWQPAQPVALAPGVDLIPNDDPMLGHIRWQVLVNGAFVGDITTRRAVMPSGLPVPPGPARAVYWFTGDDRDALALQIARIHRLRQAEVPS